VQGLWRTVDVDGLRGRGGCGSKGSADEADRSRQADSYTASAGRLTLTRLIVQLPSTATRSVGPGTANAARTRPNAGRLGGQGHPFRIET
jgi:hypothetical protein